ncbi:unnamed protein product [Penicillium glandicola]
MSVSTKTLPRTAKEWHSKMASRNMEKKTIHGTDIASASKIDLDQFLLLRVLWKPYENPAEIHKTLDIQSAKVRAAEMLRGYKSWSTYCNSFERKGGLPEGTFAIARHYQLEVVKTKDYADPRIFHTPIANRTRNKQAAKGDHLVTPTKTKGDLSALSIKSESSDDSLDYEDPETPFQRTSPMPQELANILYPPTKDEQIVNTALIVFLNALTIHFSLSLDWTLHRKSFTAAFKGTEFQARTDGYLGDSYGSPSVLVEVKPVTRDKKLDLIQMQESAQMVAWIKCDDEKAQKHRKTRIHVSQDRHQVFVTVAKYDEEYLEYLNNPNQSSDNDDEKLSFLTMHQFGPWNTLDRSHIRDLGPILLAISLQADADSKAALLG